ncbi:hypothetical protein Hanom_Chr15g01358091 [Helianthus anomalus]
MIFCALYSCTTCFMVVLSFDWLSLAVGCTWSYSHRLYSCFIKVMEAERREDRKRGRVATTTFVS